MNSELFEILEVDQSSLTISGLTFRRWGCDWDIDFIYDLYNGGAAKRFKLSVLGCKSATIEGNSNTTEGDIDADVIDIILGRDMNPHRMIIITTEFDMYIIYTDLILTKLEQW